MYELETVRSWERNPQIYAELIGSSLAGQALFAYAPEAERARRVVSKLRQVPRLVQAARDNIKDCPGIFVKVGLESWRGTLRFIESDLPRAFSGLDDLHILGDLADTSTEAATAIKSYLEYLENDLAPRAKASFRLGRERFERKLKLEDGVDAQRRSPARDRVARARGRPGGISQGRRALERRRPGRGVASSEGAASGARAADLCGRSAGRRARRISAESGARLAPRFRARHRGALAGFLPVGVCEHVDARALREQTQSRLLLPDRRRSQLVGGSSEGTPSRLQHSDALEHLDSRGVSRPFPALPASAPGGIEGAQVHALRTGVVRRGVGALLRADDGGSRLPPR